MSAFDQFGPMCAGDFFGEPSDEHAPAAAADLVDVVDLEGHVGMVGGAELGAGMGAHHDDSAVEPVVHGEDQRIVFGVDAEPPDLLGRQELVAVGTAQGLQGGAVGFGHRVSLRQ
jgi:hypothetical protein